MWLEGRAAPRRQATAAQRPSWHRRSGRAPSLRSGAHLQTQGGRVARNARPTASPSVFLAGPPAAAPPAPAKPFSAKPPGLVAPSAYFSCSVTHVVWLLTLARVKVRLQSTQVKLEPEHWR